MYYLLPMPNYPKAKLLLENTQLVCESQKEMIVNLRARFEYFQGHDAQV